MTKALSCNLSFSFMLHVYLIIIHIRTSPNHIPFKVIAAITFKILYFFFDSEYVRYHLKLIRLKVSVYGIFIRLLWSHKVDFVIDNTHLKMLIGFLWIWNKRHALQLTKLFLSYGSNHVIISKRAWFSVNQKCLQIISNVFPACRENTSFFQFNLSKQKFEYIKKKEILNGSSYKWWWLKAQKEVLEGKLLKITAVINDTRLFGL